VTGAVAAANSDAIRVGGAGSYLIAHNTVDCGWTDPGSTGINVIGQGAGRVASNAVILRNDINMSAPGGTVFGPNNAGIEIKGFAQGNSVLNNRIQGSGSAALALIDQNGGMPGNNTFVSNDLSGFRSSTADVFIDAGATNTIVIGLQAGIEDHGSGTVLDPCRRPIRSRSRRISTLQAEACATKLQHHPWKMSNGFLPPFLTDRCGRGGAFRRHRLRRGSGGWRRTCRFLLPGPR
jgi:hypothetical protein